MNGRVGVPVRVRRVSSELRELRLRSGLGAEEVAGALGFSMSKLSRIENAQRGLYADDVSALLGLYRVPAERRDELLKIVRSGANPNWWQVHGGRLPVLDDLVRFENEAVAFRNYETMVIPGLLQTSEYTVAMCEGSGRDLTPAEVDSFVGERMARQTRLHAARARQFEFLVEQGSLERLVGGAGVMYRQLKQLNITSSRDNVTLQVLPSSLGAHPGVDGPILLLEFKNHEDLVLLENRGCTSYLEEVQHVVAARAAIERLREMALTPEDSAQLIASLADRLT
ncbi:helix-turn-helix domain-containing protein [Saccharopolyspora hattusasensis]|uniref:helix-turn-helix domain-containing protein n=1 Tax=Saccharopolyspora hattusasensis TaxID=1128679 RepID=UPI003D95E417